MVVMILEKVTPALRGELSRWLIEPHAGVFVGHVNAMVRERLWLKCCKKSGEGGVLQMWSTNNEQHFDMRMWGGVGRRVVDWEGLKLIEIPSDYSPAKEAMEKQNVGASA
jgi:CRISPR-associated protein Cas2